MSQRLRIRIDLDLLRSNLSREDRQPKSEQEVRQFLIDSGFQPDGEFWMVEEENLGQLDPSEVSEVQPIDS